MHYISDICGCIAALLQRKSAAQGLHSSVKLSPILPGGKLSSPYSCSANNSFELLSKDHTCTCYGYGLHAICRGDDKLININSARFVRQILALVMADQRYPDSHQVIEASHAAEEASDSTRSLDIAQFFIVKDNSVTKAEVLMTQFLIEHNIAFSAANHLSRLVKEMFPDSRIATKHACHRTKATAIARTLGQETKGEY